MSKIPQDISGSKDSLFPPLAQFLSLRHCDDYVRSYKKHVKDLLNEKHRPILLSIIFLLSVILLIYGSLSKPTKVIIIAQGPRPVQHDPSCTVVGERWIVVTTIFYPTVAIYKFLNLTTRWNLIVIGDRKTPEDWVEKLAMKTSRLVFVSYEEQLKLNFRILRYLPQGSYARKNLGYLLAIKCGARIIFESDDDNVLDTDDIYFLPKVVQPQHVPTIAFHRHRSPFINIYGSFGHPQIWPRGFPIDEIKTVSEDGWHSVKVNRDLNTYAYIQQYLADLDPDVDAIYRLAHPLSLGQIRFDRNQTPIAVEAHTFSPYNTQNTITYYEAFWGLYLPVTTTFRVCDIWRGFWVQRLLWDIGGRLIFGAPTVNQIRNGHSYVKDMDDEQQLYHQSGSFVRFLASWLSSHKSLPKRIAQLARDIAKAGFWDIKEADIIDAWLADLRSVGYIFPQVVASTLTATPPPPAPIPRRAAVCVTGFGECIREAWTRTYDFLYNYYQGDIDAFFLLSSSTTKDRPVVAYNRLQQIRSYMNATVTVLYEDRFIDPNIPSNCTTFFYPKMDKPVMIYYQQLWALAECYDLIREYEQKMNMRYGIMIRTRSDAYLDKIPKTLEPPNSSTLIVPDNHHYGGLNDRFAIGYMSTMENYMKRWHKLSACLLENIQAEAYLLALLDRLNITVQLEPDIIYEEAGHDDGSCH